MLQERLKVLKVMNEATGHLDFNEFAKRVDLSPNETMACFRELAQTGHLRKVGSGYGLTEKGKAALKSLSPVSAGTEFEFYSGIGKPTAASAASPIEFHEIIKTIDTTSLEFHTYRKDFEAWARTALGNSALADELANIEKTGLAGEALRSAIIEAIETKYNLS